MTRFGPRTISSDDTTVPVALPSTPLDSADVVQAGTGVVNVWTYGADPSGLTDSSTAVQAAIDSNAAKVVFPPGAYLFNTVATLTRVTDNGGIEIDGQGATIIGANGIANCFLVEGPDAPDFFNHVKMHDFLFTGTVTGGFIRVNSGRTMWHEYYNLRTDVDGVAVADALLHLNNSSSTNTPGGWVLSNLKAPSNTVEYTVKFTSSAPVGYGDNDDLTCWWVQGGNTNTLYVGNGVNIIHSDFRNILSSSHGINTTDGGTVQNSQIKRMYVEPISGASHYGLAGNFYKCDIENIHGYVADHTVMTDVVMLYGTVYDCEISDISVYSAALADVPYATVAYPVITLTAGGRNTINFPAEYATNGLSINSAVWPLTFPQSPIPVILNQTAGMVTWWMANGLFTNYNQSAEATITLPAAQDNMRARFTILQTGLAYHIKAAAGDKIVLNGTALDDGDKVSNAAPALGESIFLYAFRTGVSGSAWTYDWIAVTEGGTWIDGGA